MSFEIDEDWDEGDWEQLEEGYEDVKEVVPPPEAHTQTDLEQFLEGATEYTVYHQEPPTLGGTA